MWILNALTTPTRRRWRNRNGGVKTAAWRTFRRRSTLHRAVKNERATVQGPVKKPPMDYMSHRGMQMHFFLHFFCICLAFSFLFLWQCLDNFLSHAPF